jgi:hypothetical protein
VEVSDGATVVLTGKGDVMALHQYAVKKLGARQHGIQKIQARPVNIKYKKIHGLSRCAVIEI